jgi:hypothetical protein
MTTAPEPPRVARKLFDEIDRQRGARGRLVGIPPTSGAAFIDNVGRIRKALSEKGGKYADLDEPLENPLINA